MSGPVRIDPAQIELNGPGSRWSVLVETSNSQGLPVDLTSDVAYSIQDPAIASVTPRGLVQSRSDGETRLVITRGEQSWTVPVTVRHSTDLPDLHFENDIEPILAKFGCNTSGCHGKAEGQNGFKLSVFGFDPPADYVALTQEGRGRRVFPSSPEKSLFLTKASGDVPHGGGVRIAKTSLEYQTLLDWIDAGLPVGAKDAPRVERVAVTPRERQFGLHGKQQLRVVATYTDGRQVDVTPLAKFQSNNDGLGSVDEQGLVSVGETPGEVAIMVAFQGEVDVFRAQIPRPEPLSAAGDWSENNFIDRHVAAKLQKLHLQPSGLCTDAEFLRRVSLDLTGTLPTAQAARDFLADTRADKRARVVEMLLLQPEFADYWALKWSDWLRVDRQALGREGAYLYYRWIREQLAANTPYDQFVREIVTAEGPVREAPGGYLFQAVKEPGKLASTVSQVFLGIRIECAQCHHHPFDRWSQTDYVGMTSFFTQVTFKNTPAGQALLTNPGGEVRHPRTNEVVFAHALATTPPTEQPAGDRRQILAQWLTAPDNAWFARNLANRMWAHFTGRGLVEPVDDFRLTNPPTNPELLDALAAHFASHQFDLRDLMRTIIASRTYQLSAHPNETNERDEQNYSRALLRRTDAEVLLDAVCQVTGVPEKFDGVPAGVRAIQLWDSQVPHYFLRLFGRPVRATACTCERTTEPSVAQVLHVLNSPEIHTKLSHAGGRIADWLERYPENGPLVEELYYTMYSRPPTEAELAVATEFLNQHAGARRAAVEDLTWSLLNSLEFLFNH